MKNKIFIEKQGWQDQGWKKTVFDKYFGKPLKKVLELDIFRISLAQRQKGSRPVYWTFA